MDEIIKLVSERLGVSEAVARDAIKVLLEFVRKRAAGTRLEKLLMEIPGVSSPGANFLVCWPWPVRLGLPGGWSGGRCSKGVLRPAIGGLEK